MNIVNSIFKILLFQAINPLEEFIFRNFQNSTIAIVSSNFDTLKPELTPILHLNHPKIILNSKKIPKNFEKFPNYIIIEPNRTALSASLSSLRYRINTRARFLVILQNSEDDDSRSVFETLWHFYIYNVVLYSDRTSFVTWYPYHAHSHCGKVINLVTNVKSLMNPYENKIPKELNRCLLNVTWDQLALSIKTPFDKNDPGYSIRVLDTVAEELNVDLHYFGENLKYMLPDARIRELLGKDMIERGIDFAFLGATTPEPLSPDLELSRAFMETYCYFVLPPRRKIINSTDILIVFSPQIWILIVVSVLFMVLLWKNLEHITFWSCFFQFFGFLLSSTMRRIPDGAARRLVLALFFFYGSNLSWIYVSQLSGILSKPSYEPKISTLEELASSDKILAFDDLWETFFLTRGEKKLLEKRIDMFKAPNFFTELDYFARNMNHGFIISNTRLFFIKNYKQLHLVKEKITTIQTYLMVRKGFPLLKKVNDVILRITESGIMSKWFYESLVHIDKITVPDFDDVEGHLDLERILCAFVLLGLGCLVSLFVFVCEILWEKTYGKNKK